ncbi:MAG: hypothetical protein LBR80_04030 [Deltaproteobacteria bacterium]|jgi:hypothetical protein|nr:hypothetical protein [Deltaproteobacteria bacterium]
MQDNAETNIDRTTNVGMENVFDATAALRAVSLSVSVVMAVSYGIGPHVIRTLRLQGFRVSATDGPMPMTLAGRHPPA